jgi:hypothetical protein
VRLVVSDAHAGLKKAIAQVLGCPWQRCSVPFLREVLGHDRRQRQPMLAALLRALFGGDDGQAARELVGDALERLREPLPKAAALVAEAEEDLLASDAFPADHWPKLRSTDPLERVNREIGRRTRRRRHLPHRPRPAPARRRRRDRAERRVARPPPLPLGPFAGSGPRSRQEKPTAERRRANSQRPEQPTIVSTSYTTSWDLTETGNAKRRARRRWLHRHRRLDLARLEAPERRQRRWADENRHTCAVA